MRVQPLATHPDGAGVGTRSLPAEMPDFTVALLQGGRLRLRNVGGAVATGLTVSVEPADRPVAGLPEGVRLPPLASTEPFRVASSWAPASPAELLMRCDQLPSGATVTLPPRRPRGPANRTPGLCRDGAASPASWRPRLRLAGSRETSS